MLVNKLKVLLAERNLKIKDIVENTGLSRNTISNLVNNPSSNVSTSTLDKLCFFLKITPDDFFEYYPELVKFELKDNNYYLCVHNSKEEFAKKIYLEPASYEELDTKERKFEKNNKLFRLKIEDVSDDYIPNLRKRLPLRIDQEFNDSLIKVFFFYLDKMLKRNEISIDDNFHVGILLNNVIYHPNLELLTKKIKVKKNLADI